MGEQLWHGSDHQPFSNPTTRSPVSVRLTSAQWGISRAPELNALFDDLNPAFDNLWDADGDGVLDKDCGGPSPFATAHLCL